MLLLNYRFNLVKPFEKQAQDCFCMNTTVKAIQYDNTLRKPFNDWIERRKKTRNLIGVFPRHNESANKMVSVCCSFFMCNFDLFLNWINEAIKELVLIQWTNNKQKLNFVRLKCSMIGVLNMKMQQYQSEHGGSLQDTRIHTGYVALIESVYILFIGKFVSTKFMQKFWDSNGISWVWQISNVLEQEQELWFLYRILYLSRIEIKQWIQ